MSYDSDSEDISSEDYCQEVAEVDKEKKVDFKIDENGITGEVYSTMPFSHKSKLHLITCNYCGKHYNEDMVVPYEDSQVCWHCIFCLNYSLECRKQVDGMYDMTITQYVVTCRDSHDKNNCQRSGMCFLCDNLNGKFIDGIKNGEFINVAAGDNSSEGDNDSYEELEYDSDNYITEIPI